MNETERKTEITSSTQTASDSLKWQEIGWLPCYLSLEVPVAGFTVRELLRLKAGNIVASAWSRGTEIPLSANSQLIGWAELEPVGENIGARITELV